MATTLEKYTQHFDKDVYCSLSEEMSFDDFLNKSLKQPKLLRNAFQYVYDMIMLEGTTNLVRFRKTITKYNFFSKAKTKIYGLEDALESIVRYFEGAAGGYGTQKRFLLLHGPVGSSKSTICRAIKEGLERYSRTDDGAWYTYKWVNLPSDVFASTECESAINENPVKLMPDKVLAEFMQDVNSEYTSQIEKYNESVPEADRVRQVYDLKVEGELNPRCKLFMSLLLKKYDHDWHKVISEHIVVVRKVHSEVSRVGIGTFQPKDEKNQDSTELTGDINFRNIAAYGSDSDPRAFNYDGELEIGNRGVVEFIEALKLQTEFLYDLLEVTQDHSIKPKKSARLTVDTVVLGHTNQAEMEKLRGNRFMEALRDRTIKVDVPYLLRCSDEVKVLEQDYGNNKVKQHIMPHTLEVCALFAVLTRLVDDPETKLDLRQKAKLYDGKSLPSWNEDTIKELQDKHPEEGMTGISDRYIQDSISFQVAKRPDYVNAFHVLDELGKRLDTSSLVDPGKVSEYRTRLELAEKELQEILKNEVQRACVSDESLLDRICSKYVDNVVSYVNGYKVRNQITGKDQEPDERLMRAIEEKIGIPEQGARDYRRSIAQFIGTLAHQKLEFKWDSDPKLAEAIQAKVFDDVKATIKISTLSAEAAAVDKDLQEKIDAIKTRLVNSFGYNKQSATDVLEYVSGIIASGD